MWPFNKRKCCCDKLISILKNGISININLYGDPYVQKGRDSLAEGNRGTSVVLEECSKPERDDGNKTSYKEEIPDLSNIKLPKVKFGEDTNNL